MQLLLLNITPLLLNAPRPRCGLRSLLSYQFHISSNGFFYFLYKRYGIKYTYIYNIFSFFSITFIHLFIFNFNVNCSLIAIRETNNLVTTTATKKHKMQQIFKSWLNTKPGALILKPLSHVMPFCLHTKAISHSNYVYYIHTYICPSN